jgi:hypothetical protein
VACRPDGQAGGEEGSMVVCELEPESLLDTSELRVAKARLDLGCSQPNQAFRSPESDAGIGAAVTDAA